jgi:hypothetical protein
MKQPFSKQVEPTEDAADRRTHRRTDQGPLETRVVAMTAIAFDPGASVASDEEATGGTDDCAQDAPPDALPLTRLRLLISKLPLRVTRRQ